MVYKIMHDIYGLKKKTWFDLAGARGHGTRSGADPIHIKAEKSRLEVRRNFFSNRNIKAWNRIPHEVKNARSIDAFKRMYRKMQEDS